MRLLFVGMGFSNHLARWVNALSGQGWDIHLFPYQDGGIHGDLAGLTYWSPAGIHASDPARDLVVRDPAPLVDHLRTTRPAISDYPVILAHLIRRLKPDLIHVMEFQHCGYLMLEAAAHLDPTTLPPVIVSNFGSDVYLFGRLPEHKERIGKLLRLADVLHCECARDVELCRDHGFTGLVAPVSPMGGGWDLDATAVYRQAGLPSERTTIAVKGYENWAGRAGVALEALRRCGRALAGYELAVYLATDDMALRAQILASETGMDLTIVSRLGSLVPYEAILAMHGRARVSVGLSISDGICTSMLEAMIMGAFPVQSWTACADEWIEDGIGGYLVHPEDPQPVAEAIVRALLDDRLVDQAAAINQRLARERLAYPVVLADILALYELARESRTAAARR